MSALRPAPGLAGVEEFARTDELLDGLEHAVDPDGDGNPADRAAVALVGVSAPYAGFGDAPEAEAVDGAVRLGTEVVAPAGQEGRAAGAYGTLGSPGAAAAAVAVAPSAAPHGRRPPSSSSAGRRCRRRAARRHAAGGRAEDRRARGGRRPRGAAR